MDLPVKKIDFSQYHPLDHMPFTMECYDYYGGARRHIGLAWSFKWYPKIHSKTLCLVGVHKVESVIDRLLNRELEMCIFCFKAQH